MADIEDPLALTSNDQNGDANVSNEEQEASKSTPETNGKSAKPNRGRKKGSIVIKSKKRAQKKTKKNEELNENDDGDYEVEAIVDHKKEKGKTLYLVKWKGYSAKSNSWIAASDLNCKALLTRYKKKAEKINQDTYEVEKIIDHRSCHGTIWYRIRWVGYRPSEDTWQQRSELSCPDLIKKYHEDVNQAILQREKEKVKALEEAKKKGGEYEVESIVDKKKTKNGVKYLIRWKGWDSSSDTWETEDNLNCPELIKAFNKKSSKKTAKKRKYDSSDDDDSDYESGRSKSHYEVAKICNSRVNKDGKWEFYVLWKGYGPEDCNWEPEANLNCDALINEFFGKNKIPKAVRNELEKEEKKIAATPKPRKAPTERKTLYGKRTKGALKAFHA